jgi:multiple antibiotic resistance protein
MLSAAVNSLALVMTGLFPVLNPVGAALIAQSLTPNLDDVERSRLAKIVAVNSLVILVVSVLIGTYILSFFGISVPILRVAGGCIIAFAGWQLLQTPNVEGSNGEPVDGQLETNAFYPITLPITVGPGSISVAIALGTEATDVPTIPHYIGVGVALVLLCGIVYACMRYVSLLRKFVGVAGARVIDRLFSFILLCIGMQLCWRGIADLIY